MEVDDKDKGYDNMTVFAIPMEKDKVIDEKVFCEFITQGRKRSLERKK